MYTSKPQQGLAWVTGASTGIGEMIVRQLVEKGYKVAVSARGVEGLQALVEKYPSRVFAYPCDITDKQQVKEVVEQILRQGPISLAILNAGGFLPSIEDMMTLNFSGTLNCLTPVTEAMTNQGYGQIAVMSSVSGFVALPFFGDGYVVSKAALIRLCEVLRPKLKQKGITIQVITPSFINTTLLSSKVFNMPFMLTPERAASKIVKGLESSKFEITFPKITSYWLKFISVMPYPLYFFLTRITMFFIRK
jgi:short-subunit dehydrogenase